MKQPLRGHPRVEVPEVAIALRGPNLLLPWSSSWGEDARFRSLCITLLALLLALSLVIPLLPLPQMPLLQKSKPAPQLARILLEKQPLPKPIETPTPAPVVKPPPKTEPVKPVPKPVQPKKPQPTIAQQRLGTDSGAGRETPVDLMQQARDTAAKSGVLAFRDDLQAMRDSVDVSAVTRSNLSRGAAQAEKTERSLIASRATASSGGINTSALSRDTGGIALSGRETTRIGTAAGTGAGGRGTESVQGSASGTRQGDLVAASDRANGRSDEQIRRIMDQNKGGIFSVYNRALRQNPALQGKFVFEMVIEPSGAVSEIKLISSQLADSDLSSKILTRIRMINFGSADVLRTRVNYSFDFLPY